MVKIFILSWVYGRVKYTTKAKFVHIRPIEGEGGDNEPSAAPAEDMDDYRLHLGEQRTNSYTKSGTMGLIISYDQLFAIPGSQSF